MKTETIQQVIQIANEEQLPSKYIVIDIESTGFFPWYGDRITCICAKDPDGNKFGMVHEAEDAIINDFLCWLNKHDSKEYKIITKNGKQFDIPFIMTRCANVLETITEGICLLDYPHFDLQELTKKRISLDDMAKLLGCTPKSGTGENAIKLWKEGNYDELKEYCMQDVETTEEVYLRWKMLQEFGEYQGIIIEALEDYRRWFTEESEVKMEDKNERVEQIDKALEFVKN